MSSTKEEREAAFREAAQIEGEIAEEIVSDIGMEGRLSLSDGRYEVEEADDPFSPLVIVRENDGARFEIDVDIHARRLPSEGPTTPSKASQ